MKTKTTVMTMIIAFAIIGMTGVTSAAAANTTINMGSGLGILPIMINTTESIGSCDLTIAYDINTTTPTNVTTGAHSRYIINPGEIRIIGFEVMPPGLTGEYTFAEIEFEPNTTSGSCALEITVNTLKGTNNTTIDIPLEYIIVNGIYSNVINGDVNIDGLVDMADVTAIGEYLVGGPDIDLVSADVTGNGEVDVADAMYLAYHLNEVPGFEELR